MEQLISSNEEAYKAYAAKIAPDLISKSTEYKDLDEAIEEFQKSEYSDKI